MRDGGWHRRDEAHYVPIAFIITQLGHHLGSASLLPRHERVFKRDGAGGGTGFEVGDQGVGNGVGLAYGIAQNEVDRIKE